LCEAAKRSNTTQLNWKREPLHLINHKYCLLLIQHFRGKWCSGSTFRQSARLSREDSSSILDLFIRRSCSNCPTRAEELLQDLRLFALFYHTKEPLDRFQTLSRASLAVAHPLSILSAEDVDVCRIYRSCKHSPYLFLFLRCTLNRWFVPLPRSSLTYALRRLTPHFTACIVRLTSQACAIVTLMITKPAQC